MTYWSRWVVTLDEDSSVFVFSLADCLDPQLPRTIGVRAEERRQVTPWVTPHTGGQ